MDNVKDLKILVESRLLQVAVNGLKTKYGYVILGLGLGAITMGTGGYIIAGVKGASLLGGVGGAIGGLAGATEQENISKTESPR